jgi:DNA-binding response OmpR family regulator
VIEAVWPDTMGEGVSEQAIDALVRRLRDRLAELDAEHQYVLTVRGHGFRFQNREE